MEESLPTEILEVEHHFIKVAVSAIELSLKEAAHPARSTPRKLNRSLILCGHTQIFAIT